MILKQEALKKLKIAFDLNEYEVKIWVSLLSRGAAAAGELSDMGDVPRSRAYDVLESLEKKGFIIMKLGRPIKYLAVKPEEILRRVKQNIGKRAEEEIEAVGKIQGTDVFEELNFLFNKGIQHIDPATISGSFRGRKNSYNQMLSVIDEAKEEVIIATTDTGLVRKLNYFKESLARLKKKGINIKIGAPLKTINAQEAAKELSKSVKFKEINTNARFIIVDGKDVVFMVNDDSQIHESADIGVWINSMFFASSLKDLFDASLNRQ